MEIHKPKLARNWREFALEMGTIICGILIALGLDQTVEGLHRRSEIAEAREALRSEIAQNAHIALFNIEEERCTVGVLDAVTAWVKGDGPYVQIKVTGGYVPHVTSSWEVVKAGAAAHMPLKERLAYSRFYDRVAAQWWAIDHERQLAIKDTGLGARTLRTPADMQGLLDDLAQHRMIGLTHGGNSAGIVREAKAMGVVPAPLSANERAFLAALCAEGGLAPAPPTT